MITRSCVKAQKIPEIIKSVNGRYLTVSGKNRPAEADNAKPLIAAINAILSRPVNQPQNSGFSLSNDSKYGITANDPIVRSESKESKPTPETDPARSIDRKNSTNVVSGTNRLTPAVAARFAVKVSVFSMFLAKTDPYRRKSAVYSK